MQGSEHDDPQVHPEVEDLEQLGLGECEDNNSTELGQSDATQYLKTNSVKPQYINLSYSMVSTIRIE